MAATMWVKKLKHLDFEGLIIANGQRYPQAKNTNETRPEGSRAMQTEKT